MASSTHIVLAYYLSVLFVSANAAASCDDINCVTCYTNGTCAECRGGYNNYEGGCYPCRTNCKSCKDAFFCNVCDDGFFAYESLHYTSCEKCPPNCVKCNSTSFCSECTPGYYGIHCGDSCNVCKDGACSKTDCTHGCIDGYFQQYFTYNYSYCSKCFSNCKLCTNSSHCNTCHDGYYQTSYAAGNICNQCYLNCKSCPSGRWDSTCESYCPVGCKNNTCAIYTGLCNEGCTEGYYMKPDGVCYPCLQSSSGCHCPDFKYYNGSMCTSCTDGYWGRLCNESCSLNCLDRKCDNGNGHCNICNQTYYGSFCEYKCNFNCNNRTNNSSVCNDSGECLFGCQNGWSGRTCNTVDLLRDTSSQLPKFSTTSSSEVTSSRSKQQTDYEADVPVAIIAGSVSGAIFLLTIGVCIGAVIAVLYLKRRNDPSLTDNTAASRTDPSYENTPDTNVDGMSTYTDLCHVSGEETPYSAVTQTEYENVNV